MYVFLYVLFFTIRKYRTHVRTNNMFLTDSIEYVKSLKLLLYSNFHSNLKR